MCGGGGGVYRKKLRETDRVRKGRGGREREREREGLRVGGREMASSLCTIYSDYIYIYI